MKIHLLCRLGVHRPLRGHSFLFHDIVSGKRVFAARCPCEIRWLTDSLFGFFGFRIKTKYQDDEP